MINREPVRNHMPVAPRYLTKLEYGYSGTINQGLAAGTAVQWNIWFNGCHFPGAGGVASFTTAGPPGGSGVLYPATLALNALNPTGFTQLSVLYARYRVHMSKLVLSLTPPTKAFVAVYPSADTGLPVTDFQSAMAQPFSKDYELSQYNNVKQNTIMMKYRSHEIAGLTKRQYSDSDDTAALINTNPANSIFWNIIVQPDAAATTLVGTTVNVRLTYFVEFYDPLPPTDV